MSKRPISEDLTSNLNTIVDSKKVKSEHVSNSKEINESSIAALNTLVIPDSSTCSINSDINANIYIKQGNDSFDSKDYTGAIESFSKALPLLTNDDARNKCIKGLADSYCYKGGELFETKDYTGAIEYYSKALPLVTNDVHKNNCTRALTDSYCYKGGELFETKDYTGAIEYYSKALPLVTNDVHKNNCTRALTDSYCYKGRELFKAKDYTGAIEHYSKALPLVTNDVHKNNCTRELVKSYGCKGKELSEAKDYAGAIENLSKALPLITNDVNKNICIRYLANNYRDQGKDFYTSSNYTKASDSFREGIKFYSSLKAIPNVLSAQVLDQEIVNANGFLILALLEGNKKYNELIHVIDEVENACKKISELTTNMTDLFIVYAHNKIANTLLSHDEKEAQDHYSKCLNITLSSAAEPQEYIPLDKLLNIVVRVMGANIRVMKAEANLSFPLEFYSACKHTQYTNLMKLSEIQVRNLKIAEHNKDSDTSSYYHALGETHYLLSLESRANTNELIKESIGYFKKSGTLSSLVRITDIDPKGLFSPIESILIGIGDRYYFQKNIEQAIIFYTKCVTLNPKNLDVNLTLSKWYNEMGKSKEAIYYLEKAGELYKEYHLELNKVLNFNKLDTTKETATPDIVIVSEEMQQLPNSEKSIVLLNNSTSVPLIGNANMPSSIVDLIFSYCISNEEYY